MESVPFIESMRSFLEALGVPVAHSEFAALGLLALGAVVVLLLLLRLTRRRAPSGGDASVGRLHGTVQDLSLRLNDVTGRLQGEQTRQSELLKQLVERVQQIESQLDLAPPAAVEKKNLVEQAAVPAAVAGDGQARLRSGLAKTRQGFFSRIGEIFSRREEQSGEELLEELEAVLIGADLGVKTTNAVLDHLRAQMAATGVIDANVLRDSLKATLRGILRSAAPAQIVPRKRDGQPFVLLVVGVNGVGKTTTIGKLAQRFRAEGARVMLGACDTFRAAAADQLEIWAKRTGAVLVRGEEGAKPATVAYTAVHQARDEGYDVLILDTAGRLHTRANLMSELGNLVRIVGREQGGAPHETLLVIDASTGQNALQQAREFHNLVSLTGIVVTKLDGTPKGGIVVAVKDELGVPIRYIGVGESAEDLQTFDAERFVEALFADDATAADAGLPRRRRQAGG